MFIKDLLAVIPNSDYKYRKGIDFKKVVEQAKENEYTAVVVINEDQRTASILFMCFHLDEITNQLKTLRICARN